MIIFSLPEIRLPVRNARMCKNRLNPRSREQDLSRKQNYAGKQNETIDDSPDSGISEVYLASVSSDLSFLSDLLLLFYSGTGKIRSNKRYLSWNKKDFKVSSVA